MRRLLTIPALLMGAGHAADAVALDTTVTLQYQGQMTLDGPGTRSSDQHGAYIDLEIDHAWGPLSVHAEISANENPEADHRTFDDRLYLDEIALRYAASRFDLTLGRQVLRNGRATLVNPTDYFDQRDYRDALLSTDRVRGTDAVRGAWFLDRTEVSVVYAPRHTKSLMPNTDSRWFFVLPQSADLGDGTIVPISYRWADYNGTHTDGGRPQVMLKMNHEGEGYSYAVSYFDGEDNLPGFDTLAPTLGPTGLTVAIDQLYADKRALGIDAEVLFGKVVLRAEAARVELNYPNGFKDRYDHVVAGLDLNVDKGLFGKETYFAIEYSKQFARDGQDYTKEDLRHILSNALLARVEVTLGMRDSVTTDVVYDTQNSQSAFLLEWKHELSDQFAFRLTADVLGGANETFFGQYGRNDRLGLNLEYTF